MCAHKYRGMTSIPGERVTVGIDPGVSGALGVIQGDRFIAAHDLPMLTTAQGKKQPDPLALRELLRQISPDRVIVEQVNAMPSVPGKNGKRRTMGATSAFNFGHGAGVILATVMLSGYPLTLVAPRTWKARAKLINRPKDYGRTLAMQLYPQAPLRRIKDQGRADALLIARFGQEPND